MADQSLNPAPEPFGNIVCIKDPTLGSASKVYHYLFTDCHNRPDVDEYLKFPESVALSFGRKLCGWCSADVARIDLQVELNEILEEMFGLDVNTDPDFLAICEEHSAFELRVYYHDPVNNGARGIKVWSSRK